MGLEGFSAWRKHQVQQMLEDEVEMDIAAKNFPKNKGYEAEKWDGELYNVLSKKLKGSALVTLQDTESMSGFEVWRKLRREFNPISPAMALKALVDVLVPTKIMHEKDLARAIDAWSVKMTKIQKDHGEKIGSKLKIAIVTAMFPSSMIEYIYQDITAGNSYEEFLKKGESAN